MIEKKAETIHKEMLESIDEKYDKTVGSFVFDVTQPPSKQIEKTYDDMNIVIGMNDVNNLYRKDLDRFVNQRTGQVRRKETHSVGSLTIYGNGVIEKGDFFQTESGIQFESLETKTIVGIGTIQISSVIGGLSENVLPEQITEIPVSLMGINKVSNEKSTTDGYDEESDDELRRRYLERIRTPATSGNVFHYRNWAKEVSGVGSVKVISLWNGDNTVKIIIIDSNKQPASPSLVENVQNYIDPGITGLGEGEAPIGAFATVVSASERKFNVVFNAIFDSGYDTDMVRPIVEDRLSEFMKSVAFKRDFISYAQIGGLILDSEGIADYTDLTINEGTENIAIFNDEVATLGGVTIGS